MHWEGVVHRGSGWEWRRLGWIDFPGGGYAGNLQGRRPDLQSENRGGARRDSLGQISFHADFLAFLLLPRIKILGLDVFVGLIMATGLGTGLRLGGVYLRIVDRQKHGSSWTGECFKHLMSILKDDKNRESDG